MTTIEIKDYIKSVYRRWRDYEGRSTRSEFWVFFAYHMLACFLIGVLGAIAFEDLFEFILGAFLLFQFFVVLPLAVRRMHDSGRSAWWLLLNFVPFFGNLIVLIFMLLPGEEEANRFGPNPQRFQHAPGQEVI